MLKLASWNVNSLRVRLPHVLKWMESASIDILAVQETKVIDGLFPLESFEENGYYATYCGEKNYNGVAIISKFPITDVVKGMPGFDDTAQRVISASIAGYRVINMYIPNGAGLGTDKYDYKLSFLKYAHSFIQKQLLQYPYLAVVGDFNIAPDDRDVYDPMVMKDQILVSPLERQALVTCFDMGLHDSFRLFEQETHLFSWWDYRRAGFRRNMGFRIDLILLNAALKSYCTASKIDIGPRQWVRPSDHAPVWIALKD